MEESIQAILEEALMNFGPFSALDISQNEDSFPLNVVIMGYQDNIRLYQRNMQNVFRHMSAPRRDMTLTEFTNATTYSVHKSGNDVCPIALEGFAEGEIVCRINHCGHTFKDTCLRNWFQRQSHCPVCRYDILST